MLEQKKTVSDPKHQLGSLLRKSATVNEILARYPLTNTFAYKEACKAASMSHAETKTKRRASAATCLQIYNRRATHTATTAEAAVELISE